jgi:hypothetical protein
LIPPPASSPQHVVDKNCANRQEWRTHGKGKESTNTRRGWGTRRPDVAGPDRKN